jgi:hypothetical protein
MDSLESGLLANSRDDLAKKGKDVKSFHLTIPGNCKSFYIGTGRVSRGNAIYAGVIDKNGNKFVFSK